MNIFLDLFVTFFLIGLFSFGGGMGMMTLIEQEVVIKHGWMTSEKLYQFIGISESTPGPIAVNIATFIGAEKGGILGSLCATLGVVLPSFIIILLISTFFKKFAKNRIVQTILSGVKPVILGLLFAMCIRVISTNIVGSFSYQGNYHFIWQALVITGVLAIVYFTFWKLKKKKLQPIIIIIIGALLGLGICWIGV